MSLRLLGRLLLGGLGVLALLLGIGWGVQAWRGSAPDDAPRAAASRDAAGGPGGATGDATGGAPQTALERASGDPRTLALLERADASRGVVLRRDAPPLEFELPPSASALRLLLTPNLADLEAARSRRLADPTLRWRYAVETEALDAQGRTLLKREHHFRRDLAEAGLPDGSRSTGAFYLERGAPAPLRADELRLDFAGLPVPARLRLRLLQADEDIADVLARVYTPQPQTQRDALIQWQRLSEGQRERLAAGNLFPPEALAERERESLIESRWDAVAPRSGADFRELHVLRDLPSAETPDTALPPGPTVGPGRVVAVQLPEQGGRTRVRLEPRAGAAAPVVLPAAAAAAAAAVPAEAAPPARVALRWSGHSAFERRSVEARWSDPGALEIRETFGGGWLEIESARDAAVRVWLEPEGAPPQELTPPPSFLRVWALQPGEALDHEIVHEEGRPTPLRLVLRRLAPAEQPIGAAPVDVVLLDAQGRELRRVAVPFAAPPSRHDRPWPEAPGLRVSDPQEVFFNLPPQVARVRVQSAQPLLAAAYTRPSGLPRRVRTPEDVRDPAAAETAIPAWFALRPPDHETRLLQGRTRLLALQGRPPEDRPELAAGRYLWEDFDPLRGGAARVFLAPRDPGVPERDESIANTFRPLPPDGRGRFVAAPGRTGVEPRLAWAAGQPTRFRYRVTLDGRPWAEGAAGGIAGEILLPAFAPGTHRLQVSADAPLRWWASHLAEGEPWVRREAQRFDRALSFEVERRSLDEEFVSVRAFQPAGTGQRLRVRVRIDPPGKPEPLAPLPGWLFTERVHDVRPEGGHALPVAETDGRRTDAGQPFFIPLPAGAPRGRYRITLVPEAGEGWLTLSRVTPGLVPQRRLILETPVHVE